MHRLPHNLTLPTRMQLICLSLSPVNKITNGTVKCSASCIARSGKISQRAGSAKQDTLCIVFVSVVSAQWQITKMNCQVTCTEVHALVPCLRRLAPRPALNRPWPSLAQPAWCPSQQPYQPARSIRCLVVEGSERTAGTAPDQEDELQIEGIDKKCAAPPSRALLRSRSSAGSVACADMLLRTLCVFTALSAM